MNKNSQEYITQASLQTGIFFILSSTLFALHLVFQFSFIIKNYVSRSTVTVQLSYVYRYISVIHIQTQNDGSAAKQSNANKQWQKEKFFFVCRPKKKGSEFERNGTTVWKYQHSQPQPHMRRKTQDMLYCLFIGFSLHCGCCVDII